MKAKDLRIIFMGTPDIAAYALKALVEADYNIIAVVTTPDKPAGRGRKLHQSAVKKYAVEHGLKLLQPDRLKNEEFVAEMQALNADLQIVIAFRMLPEVIWKMPKLGTFNLHASLLPQYRGAAPINWAIINGEKTTGVTTFMIDKEIDTGNILLQKEISILETDTAGDLHDKIQTEGAELIKKTVEIIASGNFKAKSQESFVKEMGELKAAPKIFKTDCKIDWSKEVKTIYNFIRGLSTYPGAWTVMKNTKTGKETTVKIFETEIIRKEHSETLNTIITDKHNIFVALKDAFLKINILQLEGKKRLNANQLLNGYSFEDNIFI